jgi:pilus assembly protein Flp/PilA
MFALSFYANYMVTWIRSRDQKGQTAAEYVGLVVLVAAILAAIFGTGVVTSLAGGVSTKVADILDNT